MQDAMLSVKEVAARLGVSPDTVRRLIRRRALKALKFPRAKNGKRSFDVYRVSDLNLEAFFKENAA